MFTGIAEEKGKIKKISRGSESCSIEIEASLVTEDSKVGDSIAVNGICLTVTKLTGSGFTADVMNETISRSSFAEMKSGDYVNLERAMRADGRFGGHIVSGHIDGVGTLSAIKNDGNAVWFTIEAEKTILDGIVEKGSIAIDGISLTVAYIDDRCFKVSLIPHTMEITTFSERKIGDRLNLENDIVGKYIMKALRPEKESGGLTMEKLLENGF
ncbi:riboflavin synthase [Lachnospiraceae bacterium C1.1]|nr:riboflavin synthase [Lachnospiraceae bacterium C1.1]